MEVGAISERYQPAPKGGGKFAYLPLLVIYKLSPHALLSTRQAILAVLLIITSFIQLDQLISPCAAFIHSHLAGRHAYA